MSVSSMQNTVGEPTVGHDLCEAIAAEHAGDDHNIIAFIHCI